MSRAVVSFALVAAASTEPQDIAPRRRNAVSKKLHGSTSRKLEAEEGVCSCLQEFPEAWASRWVANSSCQLLDGPAYTGNLNEPDYCYPVNYGLKTCDTFDENLPPYCVNADLTVRFDAPSWCTDAWCYIDPDNCTLSEDIADFQPSARQASGGDQELMFSYAACGIQSNYAKFRRSALMNADEIVAKVEEYVADVRDYVEMQAHLIRTSEGEMDQCNFLDSCYCDSCRPANGSWVAVDGSTGYSITYDSISVVHRGDTSKATSEEMNAQCLARLVEGKFKRIMRMEYDDPQRMGFLYYGDQGSGTAFWLPGTQWCTSPESIYDPRFRPWYASAVSGPKDIVLVLDNSNSMRKKNRWDVVVNAARQVLKTLSDFDYATIVLFNSIPEAFDEEPTLVQATAENLERMRQWMDDRIPVGGTNFRKAFVKAFSVIDSTADTGRTSACNSLILFLTDGKDDSDLVATDVAEMNRGRYIIFTYSFGDDADRKRPKDIACANKGLWYHIPDGGNVGDAMSSYYNYLAEPLSDSKQIRWIPYKEIITGNELIAGCLSAYDRSGQKSKLLGVVCMDVSIIISNREFRKKADYDIGMELLATDSQKCFKVSPTESDIESLRAVISYDSVCANNIQYEDTSEGSNTNGEGDADASNPQSVAFAAWLGLAVSLW